MLLLCDYSVFTMLVCKFDSTRTVTIRYPYHDFGLLLQKALQHAALLRVARYKNGVKLFIDNMRHRVPVFEFDYPSLVGILLHKEWRQSEIQPNAV